MGHLFPMLAVITIVAYAGGLGVIFMLVNETALKEWGMSMDQLEKMEVVQADGVMGASEIAARKKRF